MIYGLTVNFLTLEMDGCEDVWERSSVTRTHSIMLITSSCLWARPTRDIGTMSKPFQRRVTKSYHLVLEQPSYRNSENDQLP